MHCLVTKQTAATTRILNKPFFVWQKLFALLLLAIAFASFACDRPIEEQRADYLAAIQALNKKRFETFARLANGLKDYPLYSYLRYEYLRKNLWLTKNEEMIDFFNHNADLPMTEGLRTSWLKLLAKRGQWQVFFDNYVTQSDDTLRCYYLLARMKINNHDHLLEDIRSIWLNEKSLPPQCDKPFELLYNSGFVTNELIWERIRLAMQNNRIKLANYLGKRLDDDGKLLVRNWINIHNNPGKYTQQHSLEDSAIGREIILHGIMRLARYNIGKAVTRFNALEDRYSFLPGEVAELRRMLAIHAAAKNSPLAEQLLDAIDNYHINGQVFHYRLTTALSKKDWLLLRRWTKAKPIDDKVHERWLYWRARALEKTGDKEQATALFQELAKERNYYGFLAADKLNLAYKMNHYQLPPDAKGLQRVFEMPAIKRAYELYMLGQAYPARREWHNALSSMSIYQMQMAAKLATQWGWFDRAIFTMGRARTYDDLILRFPIGFDKLLDKYANKHNIDRSWVYGLVRAESAFIEDARSPAGALGLMQVMPTTGWQTSKRIGMKDFKSYKLKRAETNVPIGTAYMEQMLERFSGNMVLATAAYNAGPNQVDKWMPKKDCAEPDVWIEQIPFNETRKYVSRVLAYTSIYDWRLHNKFKSLNERMAIIYTLNKGVLDKLSCTSFVNLGSRYVN